MHHQLQRANQFELLWFAWACLGGVGGENFNDACSLTWLDRPIDDSTAILHGDGFDLISAPDMLEAEATDHCPSQAGGMAIHALLLGSSEISSVSGTKQRKKKSTRHTKATGPLGVQAPRHLICLSCLLREWATVSSETSGDWTTTPSQQLAKVCGWMSRLDHLMTEDASAKEDTAWFQTIAVKLAAAKDAGHRLRGICDNPAGDEHHSVIPPSRRLAVRASDSLHNLKNGVY